MANVTELVSEGVGVKPRQVGSATSVTGIGSGRGSLVQGDFQTQRSTTQKRTKEGGGRGTSRKLSLTLSAKVSMEPPSLIHTPRGASGDLGGQRLSESSVP